jgi:hypothetical protein
MRIRIQLFFKMIGIYDHWNIQALQGLSLQTSTV